MYVVHFTWSALVAPGVEMMCRPRSPDHASTGPAGTAGKEHTSIEETKKKKARMLFKKSNLGASQAPQGKPIAVEHRDLMLTCCLLGACK